MPDGVQFMVHLRLQSPPRWIAGTTKSGRDYAFYALDGQAVALGMGMVGVRALTDKAQPGDEPVQGIDLGRLEYFGCSWFPPADDEVLPKDARKLADSMSALFRHARAGATLQVSVRLDFRYAKSAGGSSVRMNNFVITKAKLLLLDASPDSGDEVELPF